MCEQKKPEAERTKEDEEHIKKRAKNESKKWWTETADVLFDHVVERGEKTAREEDSETKLKDMTDRELADLSRAVGIEARL